VLRHRRGRRPHHNAGVLVSSSAFPWEPKPNGIASDPNFIPRLTKTKDSHHGPIHMIPKPLFAKICARDSEYTVMEHEHSRGVFLDVFPGKRRSCAGGVRKGLLTYDHFAPRPRC